MVDPPSALTLRPGEELGCITLVVAPAHVILAAGGEQSHHHHHVRDVGVPGLSPEPDSSAARARWRR
jgi:hypothetical protein